MLKKAETVAPSVKGGPAQLAGLYSDMVAGMITYYGSDSTVYAKTMIQQARAFVQEQDLKQASANLENRIREAKSKLKAK